MSRGVSIAKMMAATALIGLDFGLVRSWSGPEGAVETLGELAPMAVLVPIGLATALLSNGYCRRFGRGLAVSSAIVYLSIFLAPAATRHALLDRVVAPLQVRGILPISNGGWSLLDLPGPPPKGVKFGMIHSAHSPPDEHYWHDLHRCPFEPPWDRKALGIAEAVVSLAWGAIAAYLSGRRLASLPADLT